MKLNRKCLFLTSLLAGASILSASFVPLAKAATATDPRDTASQTEPSDFNIYFRPSNIKSKYSYVWGWSDSLPSGVSGYGFRLAEDPVTVNGISGVEFRAAYLTFNKEYDAYTSWEFTSQGTMTLSDPSLFTGMLFRGDKDNSGVKTKDFTIDPTKIQKDSSGHYNIYIDETKGVYYTTASFPTSPIKNAYYNEVLNADGSSSAYIELIGKSFWTIFPSFSQDTFVIDPYIDTDAGYRIYDYYLDIPYENCKVISNNKAIIALKNVLDPTKKYEIRALNGLGASPTYAGEVSFDKFYASNAFDRKYYYDGTLGAHVKDNKTTYRLWAPVAQSVTLNVYDHPSDETPSAKYPMTDIGRGVWEYVVDKNAHATYYSFDIDNFGIVTEDVPDPYAESSNVNGKHSMVVDFNKIKHSSRWNNAKDWTPDFDSPSEISIMEMHTRDFTSAASWNGTDTNRGKFTGLFEEGTSLPDGTPTGYDYVAELADKGLTHVQILPAYDFASVDETKLNDRSYQKAPKNGIYNWGYDPQQYNAPEGSYSTNPNDGVRRVQEFTDFVSAYNDLGVGVVMDVVYNHMPSADNSAFQKVFPGYYFRQTNYSGAGSDLASQKSMVRKFIVDSVTMWATQYHVSGFRFDLMGLLDAQTMQAVRAALNAVNPKILVYGEAWSMFGGDSTGIDHITALDMATQSNLNSMGENWVGAFNDDIRDSFTGQNTNPDAWGYAQMAIQGNPNETLTNQKKKIYYGLSGTMVPGDTGRPVYAQGTNGIGASITYAECHDNATLWDKLALTTADDSQVKLEASLTNQTILSSLSPAFFQLGQSFGRSKAFESRKYMTANGYYEDKNRPGIYYSHNSYNLGDEVNRVEWNLLSQNKDMESDFEAALSRRKENGSKIRSLSYADFTKNSTDEEKKAYVDFQSDVVNNPYVVSYSIKLESGKRYTAIVNYSMSDVTYDGVTVKARSSDSFIR